MVEKISEKPIVVTSFGECIKFRWKAVPCHTGDSCWCRVIVPEPNVVFPGGEEVYISHAADLGKDIAEHVVSLHNTWLENKENGSK